MRSWCARARFSSASACPSRLCALLAHSLPSSHLPPPPPPPRARARSQQLARMSADPRTIATTKATLRREAAEVLWVGSGGARRWSVTRSISRAGCDATVGIFELHSSRPLLSPPRGRCIPCPRCRARSCCHRQVGRAGRPASTLCRMLQVEHRSRSASSPQSWGSGACPVHASSTDTALLPSPSPPPSAGERALVRA